MAKGNDGNYLQHSVEVAVAARLAESKSDHRLHVAITHGMAPLEPCDEPPSGQTTSLLRQALRAAQRDPVPGEPAIVSAYRAASASLSHYPNTAELLRHVVGSDRLSGAIAEVDATKCAQLQEAWTGTGITAVNSSWRLQTERGGILTCPENLDAPWLFTMDPMTYREKEPADDAYVYRADLPRISSALRGFVRSGQPGVAALFVYAVRPKIRPKFWAFADSLADHTGARMTTYWITHQGGNRNLAALFWSCVEPSGKSMLGGLNRGR